MKTVIIGNGPAGFYTATKLAALAPDEEITLIERESEPFYAKIRMPEYVADKIPREKLYLGTAESLSRLGIRLVQGAEITSIDPGAREVISAKGKWAYDRLVLATGSRAFVPPVGGSGAADILTLRTLADADALRERCKAGSKVLVMGGGLLGLEAAWCLHDRGAEVTVAEYFPRLLPRQLNEDQARLVQTALEGAGLAFKLGRTVAAVEKLEGSYRAELDNGEILEVAAVLASAGVRPVTEVARSAGIVVEKGIVVNERFETSVPGIYALGDCAEMEGKLFGLWMAAMAQAEGLAKILSGAADRFVNRVYEPVLKVPGIDMKSLMGA